MQDRSGKFERTNGATDGPELAEETVSRRGGSPEPRVPVLDQPTENQPEEEEEEAAVEEKEEEAGKGVKPDG